MNNRTFQHLTRGTVYIDRVRLEYDSVMMTNRIDIRFLTENGEYFKYSRKITDEQIDVNPDAILESVAVSAGIPGAGWALGKILNGESLDDYVPVYQTKKDPTPLIGDSFDILQGYLEQLPGIEELVVHPVNHSQMTVREAIIRLNDSDGWSREKIADWLDTLDVDLRFKSEDAKLAEQGQLQLKEKTDTELKMEKLESHLKNLMQQLDDFQVTIAYANKSFLALKEALENEQN